MTQETQEQVLERYRRWLYRKASDMLWESSAARHTLTVDDLAQEGWVAMWRALQTFDPAKGNETVHLQMAAIRRMLHTVSGRPTLGTDPNYGRTKVPETALTTLPEPGSPLEPVFQDYSQGEPDERIEAALASMPPKVRKYVEDVFWGNKRHRPESVAWRDAVRILREHVA